MDYEKAYKEALERARELKNKLEKSCSLATPTGIESIFPELKMSEDDKIRNEILSVIRQFDNDSFLCGKNYDYKKWIAWLEKQAEPQPYRGNADTMRKNLIKAFKSVGSNHWGGFDVRDIIHFLESKDAIELEKQGETYTKKDVDDAYLKGICDAKRELEKQGEQKPVDSYCEEHCKGFQETGKCFADGECKAKKDAEQKPAWSDEDELRFKQAIYICHQNGYFDIENWLKSLKPQPHWKPSEEQMKALDDAIDICSKQNNEIGDWLDNLREQLKKLREE